MAPTRLFTADGQEVQSGLQSLDKLLAKYGLPTFLLLLVGYFFLWPAWNKQVEATPRIELKLDQHMRAMDVEERRRFEHAIRLETYLRLTCVNTAKTEAAKQTCMTVR